MQFLVSKPSTTRTTAVIAGLGMGMFGGTGLTACTTSDKTSEHSKSGSSIRVVTSNNIYADLVGKIGTNRVSVVALLDDPSADPHEFQATPAQAATVSRSDVIIINGGGYDTFLTKLAEANPSAKVIDAVVTSGLPGSATAGTSNSTSSSFNEHIWYSLPSMQLVAGAIAKALSEKDPTNAAEYNTRNQELTSEIGSLIAMTDTARSKFRDTKVASTEPVAGYLLQSMGLNNVTPGSFAEAIADGQEPSAAALKEKLDLIRNHQVKLLTFNEQTSSPSTKKIKEAATEAGLPLVKVYETLPDKKSTYVGFMRTQIEQIINALQTR